jgi:hypothetical protein
MCEVVLEAGTAWIVANSQDTVLTGKPGLAADHAIDLAHDLLRISILCQGALPGSGRIN